jgi:23S rRNA (pseudouridine1915-N3)-methyltransferase
MPIKIIAVSKPTSGDPAAECAESWLAKLRQLHAAPVELRHIKPNPSRTKDVAVAKQAEAERVLAAISPRERVVLLDERGRDVKSEDFAALIAAAGDEGQPLTFLIGGPFGHGPAAAARADDSIRLSRCVLNHAVALVVLSEQLYRGVTILQGSPYHH